MHAHVNEHLGCFQILTFTYNAGWAAEDRGDLGLRRTCQIMNKKRYPQAASASLFGCLNPIRKQPRERKEWQRQHSLLSNLLETLPRKGEGAVWDLGVDPTQSPCEPEPPHVFRPRGLAAGAALRLDGHPLGEGSSPEKAEQTERSSLLAFCAAEQSFTILNPRPPWENLPYPTEEPPQMIPHSAPLCHWNQPQPSRCPESSGSSFATEAHNLAVILPKHTSPF